MRIRELREEDLPAVANLHVLRFPNSRSTDLGRPFLRKMYRWFLTRNPQLSFVAEADGNVVGFAVGSTDIRYGSQVLRYALWETMLGVMLNPQMLCHRRTFFRVGTYLRSLLPQRTQPPRKDVDTEPAQTQPKQIELASLATAPSATGAGLFLVLAFERAAQREGADVVAGTVREDNTALRSMYERLKWRRAWKVGTEGVYYRKTLTAGPAPTAAT